MYHIIDKQSGKILAYEPGSFRQAEKKASKYGISAEVKFATDKTNAAFMAAVEREVTAYEAMNESL